jgi:hypothetical protein
MHDVRGHDRDRARTVCADHHAAQSHPGDGSITVGFAQLARGDSPMDLIDRADRQLIAARDTRHQAQRAAAAKSAGNEKEPGNADSDNDAQSATQKRKMKATLDDFLRRN